MKTKKIIVYSILSLSTFTNIFMGPERGVHCVPGRIIRVIKQGRISETKESALADTENIAAAQEKIKELLAEAIELYNTKHFWASSQKYEAIAKIYYGIGNIALAKAMYREAAKKMACEAEQINKTPGEQHKAITFLGMARDLALEFNDYELVRIIDNITFLTYENIITLLRTPAINRLGVDSSTSTIRLIKQLAEQPNTEEIISKLYTARLMEDNLRIFRQKTGLYY